MQQEAVLAMLAKEPSHGYQLRQPLRQALGPLGEGMNDGQIYVTLRPERRDSWHRGEGQHQRIGKNGRCTG